MSYKYFLVNALAGIIILNACGTTEKPLDSIPKKEISPIVIGEIPLREADVSSVCAAALIPIRTIIAEPPTKESMEDLSQNPDLFDDAYDVCGVVDIEKFMAVELYPWIESFNG